MKKCTWFAGIVVGMLIAFTGICGVADAGSLCQGRFMLGLAGIPDAELSLDIIAVSYDDRRDDIEITLRNWEALQYKYSDGNLLVQGAQVFLFTGCGTTSAQKMAEGKVESIAPGFHQGEPSTIVISARGIRSMPAGKQITLTYGGSLLEFYPVFKDGAITGKGMTTGMPDLRTGVTLIINGVGERYGGEYSVTGTIHTFDNTKGYKTQFTVQRVVKRLRTSAANEIYPELKDIRNRQ